MSNRSNDNITIFPNPTNEGINIQPKRTDPFSIMIYNLKGQMVYSENNLKGNSYIDSSSLNSGVYIVTIIYSEEVISKKIIIDAD